MLNVYDFYENAFVNLFYIPSDRYFHVLFVKAVNKERGHVFFNNPHVFLTYNWFVMKIL